MPHDTWAHRPEITPHGYGFSLPLAITEIGSGTFEDPTRFTGIRLEVRSLNRVDIEAGINSDPDATGDMLAEALARSIRQTAPNAQAQLDEILDILVGGL